MNFLADPISFGFISSDYFSIMIIYYFCNKIKMKALKNNKKEIQFCYRGVFVFTYCRRRFDIIEMGLNF